MSQIGEQLLTLVDALSRNSTQHDDNQHNSTSSKLLYDQLRARRLRLSSRILASHLTPGVELSDKAHITKVHMFHQHTTKQKQNSTVVLLVVLRLFDKKNIYIKM